MNITTHKRVLDPSMLYNSMRGVSPPQAHTIRDVMSKRMGDIRSDSKEAQDLLRSQELFLSVVLDWQQHEHSDSSVLGESSAQSDNFYNSSVESSEGSDHEGGVANQLIGLTRSTKLSKPLKLVSNEDPSPTNLPKIHHISPSIPLPALNLNNLLPIPSKRIGIYTPRSRRALLDKYMEKRTKRLSRKKVRYRVRKTLANARPRVKGRFVKTEQPLTAAAVEEMERKQQPSLAKASASPSNGDFDYTRPFYECERGIRSDVQDTVNSIITTKRRRGEVLNWEELSCQLDQVIASLLPSQYVDSPLPDIFTDLAVIIGDAEEECTQESYTKALYVGAVYIAICLSLYSSTRHPNLWEAEESISPILKHYLPEIKQLWARRKTKRSQTYEFMDNAISGIAAVVFLGYENGKKYLKPVFI